METTGLSGSAGCFVGRVWVPGEGPAVVALRGDAVHDITSRTAPTMTDVLERPDPAAFVKGQAGRMLGTLGAIETALATLDIPHGKSGTSAAIDYLGTRLKASV